MEPAVSTVKRGAWYMFEQSSHNNYTCIILITKNTHNEIAAHFSYSVLFKLGFNSHKQGQLFPRILSVTPPCALGADRQRYRCLLD